MEGPGRPPVQAGLDHSVWNSLQVTSLPRCPPPLSILFSGPSAVPRRPPLAHCSSVYRPHPPWPADDAIIPPRTPRLDARTPTRTPFRRIRPNRALGIHITQRHHTAVPRCCPSLSLTSPPPPTIRRMPMSVQTPQYRRAQLIGIHTLLRRTEGTNRASDVRIARIRREQRKLVRRIQAARTAPSVQVCGSHLPSYSLRIALTLGNDHLQQRTMCVICRPARHSDTGAQPARRRRRWDTGCATRNVPGLGDNGEDIGDETSRQCVAMRKRQ
jgi:hypothetical protein